MRLDTYLGRIARQIQVLVFCKPMNLLSIVLLFENALEITVFIGYEPDEIFVHCLPEPLLVEVRPDNRRLDVADRLLDVTFKLLLYGVLLDVVDNSDPD
jgi:hypothetical protein